MTYFEPSPHLLLRNFFPRSSFLPSVQHLSEPDVPILILVSLLCIFLFHPFLKCIQTISLLSVYMHSKVFIIILSNFFIYYCMFWSLWKLSNRYRWNLVSKNHAKSSQSNFVTRLKLCSLTQITCTLNIKNFQLIPEYLTKNKSILCMFAELSLYIHCLS